MELRNNERYILAEISGLIEKNRQSLYAQLNHTTVMMFWQIGKIVNNVVSTLSTQLSWSHFIEILSLKSMDAKLYYLNQAASGTLGIKAFRKLISRKAYERKEIANTQLGHQSGVPANTFKDPYLFDILGLRNNFLEKRLIAVELKIGKFQAKYKGQMELYLKWLDRYERQQDENPPIGLILCTQSSREQVELLEMDKSGIMVAEYWTDLPPKKEFEKKIHSLLLEAQERLEHRLLAPLKDELD